MKVFEEYLLDADWSLNAANWMWLSASAFFHQYFRVYSPIVFGKKTDPRGLYIKKYIPKLSKFPEKYIYEPWEAPLEVQKRAGCIIGKVWYFSFKSECNFLNLIKYWSSFYLSVNNAVRTKTGQGEKNETFINNTEF